MQALTIIGGLVVATLIALGIMKYLEARPVQSTGATKDGETK